MRTMIFGAGSDLGVHIDGASLGPTQLMNDLKTFYKGERNHFFIGKKIISPEKYNYLVNLRGIDNSQYFPQYRV